MTKRLGLLLTALLLVPAAGANAQIYVDKDASGAGDGTSWTDAYTNLQDALAEATASDEIWIAEGVYTPDPDGTDETKSFTITGGQDGLALYGGFDGTESQRSGRDSSQHVTVLSGDVDGNDNTNADGVTETASDISGANSEHVFWLDGTSGEGITQGTIIDGVTVTAGQNEGTGADDIGGGGLFCDARGQSAVCSPTLVEVRIIGNTGGFGGGMLFEADGGTANPSITSATFKNNACEGSGCAIDFKIYNGGTSSPTVSKSTFVKNTTESSKVDGGTIRYDGPGSPVFSRIFFSQNDAKEGGALHLSDAGDVVVRNAVFVENDGEGGGGLLGDGLGGAIYTSVDELSLTGTTFANNSASNDGGAIYHSSGATQITNTILWGNAAGGSGDEVYRSSETVKIAHSIVQGGCGAISGATCGAGNLDQAPRFAGGPSAAGDDGVFATRDDSLNVDLLSPTLDAGINDSVSASVDLTGATRIQDKDLDGTATVNIGAYEAAVGPAAATGAPSAVTGRSVDLSGTVRTGAFPPHLPHPLCRMRYIKPLVVWAEDLTTRQK